MSALYTNMQGGCQCLREKIKMKNSFYNPSSSNIIIIMPGIEEYTKFGKEKKERPILTYPL
jgi:hypothetical protein